MPVSVDFNLAYGDHPRQRADVYTPRRNPTGTTIIFWHGGSWQRGSKSTYRFVGRALARLGYQVVLPNYRLFPEVAWPVFAEDAAQVVAWTSASYPEQRIVAMGHSAGAQIAAAVSYDRSYLEAVGRGRIVGFIGAAGAYTFNPGKALSAVLAASNHDWRSPALVGEAPVPAFLIHGRRDHIMAMSATAELAEAIRQHGGNAIEVYYSLMGHFTVLAPFVMGWWAFPRLKRRLAEFIASA